MNCVQVKEYLLTLPTYREPAHEKLPMFAENRVHQRSSGNPYPNPVVLEVERGQRMDAQYRCICLENDFIKLEMLPELGGRIYSALDKTTGYDFFYKQHVIKPALIGMLGSWVSGGLEFNWPCHHRPSTYMPVDYTIEKEDGGAVTLWMSEHEPLNRMKGMVGVRLAPDEARFETRMRVYNRTQTRRSFLWWENAAVPVNETYELFFPPDVHFVQFHYRKNVTSYPIAKGVYNGIRMTQPTDIRMHKNTRQPTSYFCAASHYDFFGGYDNGRQAGVVHIADHNVSIGKKMFTWAYNQLSSSWEHALTDTDGAYAELMASSYSANQPDFAWLQPYEEKRFSQTWYPIGSIGAPVCATLDAALSVQPNQLMLQSTTRVPFGKVMMNGEERPISLEPGKPVSLVCENKLEHFELQDETGRILLSYMPAQDRPEKTPWPIQDNPTLDCLTSADACYKAGLHVSQYRDPALSPAAYWEEALRYDPNHAAAHQELARYLYDHYFFEEALDHALKAWQSITVYNEHPLSGDIPYLIGLILEALGRDAEAMDWHQKAAWAEDARSRAMTRISMLDGRKKDWHSMALHADEALKAHLGNGVAYAEKALALFHQGKPDAARQALECRLAQDPCDRLCDLLLEDYTKQSRIHVLTDAWQTALDLAEDLEAMGENERAQKLLSIAKRPETTAWPIRQSELKRLQDGSDPFGLACLYYGTGHYEQAARLWEKQPQDYRAVRCLAVAYFSHLNRPAEALELLEKALEMAPCEKQLIFEKAYLMGRLNTSALERIRYLAPLCDCHTREDILIEYVRALNQNGQYEQAIQTLLSRPFTPCEGGEHAVALQYMLARHGMAQQAYHAGDYEKALALFRDAQRLPDSLGAGLWNEVHLVPHRFYEAECLRKLGQEEEAVEIYQDITALLVDYFSNMHLPELPCWQALSWMRLGQSGRAEMMLREHIHQYEAAKAHRDAGYYGTTPFFISYMEPAAKLRQAQCEWQIAVALWAMGEKADSALHAQEALKGEPFLLYAGLLLSDAQACGQQEE